MISINITYINQDDDDLSWFILQGEYKVTYGSSIVNNLEAYGYTNWCMLGQFIFIRIAHQDYWNMIADDNFQDIKFVEVIPDYPTDNSLTATFTPLYT